MCIQNSKKFGLILQLISFYSSVDAYLHNPCMATPYIGTYRINKSNTGSSVASPCLKPTRVISVSFPRRKLPPANIKYISFTVETEGGISAIQPMRRQLRPVNGTSNSVVFRSNSPKTRSDQNGKPVPKYL